MYESHFGFSGAPFQLNPDPSFYFESRGHHSALSYLKFGVHQGEGFIVVTGEIGAGKTTLVRTLLRELDPEKVVAAQIVSTQLEAGDLLRSVAAAFGISTTGVHKADLIATIEGFLTLLATKNRRALLIVDEAQNLGREAVEELRMLSNFQLGNKALLQSFLVGQPELRTVLTSKSMEQFRQRVIASCHLGPMDRAETRAYVEHRLQHVGWKGNNPAIAEEAFDEVFRWTSGVPRRINILCNRVLLATFLGGHAEVDATLVRQTAQDLRVEIGESAMMPPLSDAAVEPMSSAAVAPSVLGDSNAGTYETAARRPDPPARGAPGPILCIVGGRSNYIKMIPLLRALAARRDLPQALLVQTGRLIGLNLTGVAAPDFSLPQADFNLGVESAPHAVQTAEVMKRFDPLIEEYRPSAVIVVGSSDSALACSLVASKRGTPVMHVEAGLRSFDRSMPDEINRVLTDQIADVLYTTGRGAHYTLTREGIPADRIQFVGNLLVDALRLILPVAPQPIDTMRRASVPPDYFQNRNGYGLVVMNHPANLDSRSALSEALATLRQVSRDCPLVWPVHPATRAKIESFGLQPVLDDARVFCIPMLGYLEMVGLMGGATCVLTDSMAAQEDAAALNVSCLPIGPGASTPISVEQSGAAQQAPADHGAHPVMHALGDLLKSGGRRGMAPEYWDGCTADRIAQHLSGWMRQRGTIRDHVNSEAYV